MKKKIKKTLDYLNNNPVYLRVLQQQLSKSGKVKTFLYSRTGKVILILASVALFLVNFFNPDNQFDLRPTTAIFLGILAGVLVLIFYYRAVTLSIFLMESEQERINSLDPDNSQIKTCDVATGNFWFAFKTLWQEVSIVWLWLTLLILVMDSYTVRRNFLDFSGYYVVHVFSLGSVIMMSLWASIREETSKKAFWEAIGQSAFFGFAFAVLSLFYRGDWNYYVYSFIEEKLKLIVTYPGEVPHYGAIFFYFLCFALLLFIIGTVYYRLLINSLERFFQGVRGENAEILLQKT